MAFKVGWFATVLRDEDDRSKKSKRRPTGRLFEEFILGAKALLSMAALIFTLCVQLTTRLA